MLKRGLPETSVRHAMMRDGVDTSILDRDPEELVEIESSGRGNAVEKTKTVASPKPVVKKIPLKEHPEWEKYFTMLSRGLPVIQIKRTMRIEGKDSSMLDHDPNELIEVMAVCHTSFKSVNYSRKRLFLSATILFMENTLPCCSKSYRRSQSKQ